jgi:hypothetical protein
MLDHGALMGGGGGRGVQVGGYSASGAPQVEQGLPSMMVGREMWLGRGVQGVGQAVQAGGGGVQAGRQGLQAGAFTTNYCCGPEGLCCRSGVLDRVMVCARLTGKVLVRLGRL